MSNPLDHFKLNLEARMHMSEGILMKNKMFVPAHMANINKWHIGDNALFKL